MPVLSTEVLPRYSIALQPAKEKPNAIPAVLSQAWYRKTFSVQGLFIEHDLYWIKLKDVNLTYELPGKIIKPAKISAASITLTARNFLLSTNYTGSDPDLGTRNGLRQFLRHRLLDNTQYHSRRGLKHYFLNRKNTTMSTIRFKHIIQLGVIGSWLTTLTSCDLSKTNVNPNASSEVSLSAVLTGAQTTLAFNTGINAGLLTNIYTQQASGANGDAAPFDNYTTSPGYFNGTWLGYYTNVLTNLKIIQQTATKQQLPYYSGIARVLTAFAYGNLTDIFGDVPFTESLYGNGITNPAYDKQQLIYDALQLQLDSAIIDLSQPQYGQPGRRSFNRRCSI